MCRHGACVVWADGLGKWSTEMASAGGRDCVVVWGVRRDAPHACRMLLPTAVLHHADMLFHAVGLSCCVPAAELRRCSALRELHLEYNRLATPLLDLTHASALESLQV